MVLTCFTFLIFSDVHHVFTYLLSMCRSSLGKCLVSASDHFLIRLIIFLLLNCINSLYILNINSSPDKRFQFENISLIP